MAKKEYLISWAKKTKTKKPLLNVKVIYSPSIKPN